LLNAGVGNSISHFADFICGVAKKHDIHEGGDEDD
jgi:hypothetical protein